jgi:hypothetical protein
MADTNVALVKIKSDLTLDEIADEIEVALGQVPEFLEVSVEGFFEFGDKEGGE